MGSSKLQSDAWFSRICSRITPVNIAQVIFFQCSTDPELDVAKVGRAALNGPDKCMTYCFGLGQVGVRFDL